MKNNTKKVFDSSIAQSVSFFVSLFITFWLTPLMIHKLGDHAYGIWILISMISNYLSLSELGLTSAVKNHLAICLGKGDLESYSRILSNGFIVYLFISCAVAFFVLISVTFTRFFWHSPNASLFSSLFLIVGMTIAASFLFYPYSAMLTSHIRYDILAWIAIIQSLTNALITIAALNFGGGLFHVSLAGLASTMVANLLLFAFARRISPTTKLSFAQVNRDDLVSLMQYSGKTFLAQLSDILRFKVDEVVTGACLSITLIPHYAVANKLVTTANGLCNRMLGSIETIFARQVGRKDHESLRESFILSLKLTSVLSCLIYAGLLLLGEHFLLLWLGPRYLDSYWPMVILGASLLLGMMQSPGVGILYATNKHQYLGYMSLFEGLLNLSLSVAFVSLWHLGLNGVALGTLVPILITKLYIQPRLVCWQIQHSLAKYYALLAKLLISGGVLYGVAFLLMRSLIIDSYLRLAFAALFLAVLAPIQLGFSLTVNERAVLWGLWRQLPMLKRA